MNFIRWYICGRFCVGDRFYLCDNKVLCEYDYEERMVFASMSYNYNALTQVRLTDATRMTSVLE